MTLLQTPLNERHRALGAKMVDFGGWDMPVQYHSILKEHEAVRQRAGLFDVSHMGVYELRGPDSLAALQRLVPNDLSRLSHCQGLYTQLCAEDGGTLDDLLVFCLDSEKWWIIVNAGNRQPDFDWIASHASGQAELVSLADHTGILALQGPKAAEILAQLTDHEVSSEAWPAFGIRALKLAERHVIASRSGYTGEDGFELYVPHEYLGEIWDRLLAVGKADGLEPVGLGARDTLRLEAAMPLYGHELDRETTPLEALLGWSVKLQKADDFIGKQALQAEKAAGLKKKRIGFSLPDGKRAPRQGYELYAGDRRIGVVTSGSLSPTLGYPIGMGYVDAPWYQDLPAELSLDIRGQRHPVQVVKLPFYKRQNK